MMMIEKRVTLKLPAVPVRVRTLGRIKKGTNKNINKIPGNPSLYEIQKRKKNALYGTAHHLRRALPMWLKNIA